MTGPRHAETMDDVLGALREMVDDCIGTDSRIGYFAARYRQVALAVKRAIDDGVFDDGERMSRLDAAFANRYLEALHAWRSDGRPSRSWRTAYRAADDDRPVLVQHLSLGVNAHINLDLPIASARLCPGEAIGELQRDFDLVNGILSTVLGDLQVRLAVLSPLLGALDVVLGRLDEEIVGFNVQKARSEAVGRRRPPGAAAGGRPGGDGEDARPLRQRPGAGGPGAPVPGAYGVGAAPVDRAHRGGRDDPPARRLIVVTRR
jgi:hypothetical protein